MWEQPNEFEKSVSSDLCFLQLKQICGAATHEIFDVYPVLNNKWDGSVPCWVTSLQAYAQCVVTSTIRRD